MPCGSARLHTVPNQVAEGLTVLDVAPSRQAIARRLASGAPGRLRRPVVVVGRAGASGPTRPERARGRRPGQGRSRAKRALGPGQWRDAQGFRLSRLDGERIVHVLRWPQVQQEEQLGEALQPITEAGVMPEAQVRLCVVGEGAEGIWQHVQGLWPQAPQVLAYDHCAQYLHRVATAHDDASVQALEWVEATMPRLALGQVGVVLGGLRRMQAQSDEAEKAMAHGGDYLHEHRGRTADHKLRRGGSPLGSGGIASSNKCMCHVRLQRSGAWW